MDQTDLDRFWRLVHVRGQDECWPLKAGDQYSYGRFTPSGGKTMPCHRASWTIAHGDPGVLYVLHKCDNPPCVNPTHLFLGTQSDNMRDMIAKGRHGRLRLNHDSADRIRELYAEGLTQTEIANQFGVDYGLVHNIVIGKSWRRS